MGEAGRMSKQQSVSVVIEEVNLSYGRNHVLKDMNLEIAPGEFFAFLGPSGCGKTTLLRVIAGFAHAQTGRVLIGGQDVAGLPPWRRNVGMVFQSYALWPHMSVYRNVAFGLEEHHVPRAEIRRRVEWGLELVGLEELANRRPSQLSGGQQQRVALARTLVVEPQVLLLDEPLSNLDAKLRVQMRHELVELQRKLGITTIFVTHDQEEANTISDRLAVIDAGVIQQVGTPIDLYDHPSNLFVADFLGMANVIHGKVTKERRGLTFRAEGIAVPLRAGQPGTQSIVFRPQSLAIRPARAKVGAGQVALDGRVQEREFLGSLVRYNVDVNGNLLLVEDTYQIGSTPFAVDAPVRLLLDPGHIIALAG